MARILLLEDDEALVSVYRRTLEGDGHAVDTAADHDAARDLLQGDAVHDLAILDFWVGEGSSLGILSELRERRPGIPVLYISGGGGGLSLEVTAALAESGGAAEFLFKPVRPRDICAAVKRLL